MRTVPGCLELNEGRILEMLVEIVSDFVGGDDVVRALEDQCWDIEIV